MYLAKRSELLRHYVNFVELDLLRGGPRMPMEQLAECDYYALVSRCPERPDEHRLRCVREKFSNNDGGVAIRSNIGGRSRGDQIDKSVWKRTLLTISPHKIEHGSDLWQSQSLGHQRLNLASGFIGNAWGANRWIPMP